MIPVYNKKKVLAKTKGQILLRLLALGVHSVVRMVFVYEPIKQNW